MDIATIPYTRLDPGNALARDYCTNPDRVLPLFEWDYRDPRALAPLAEIQKARRRPALGELLADYNREVGGDVECARSIDDGLCVISGQQVGLLLGPAYTTYKLFTVINAAKRLEHELGVPVTPVFWVESEDHDWAEANRFFWKGRRYRINADAPPGIPVCDVNADAAPFLAEVREALPRDGAAWDIVEPVLNVAAWHVRNLARLVAGCGVVFVEPRLLREAMRPLAEQIASASDEIDALLVRETGYERPLAPPRGGYLFDAPAGSGRLRIERGVACPDAWSTDVVSRVLVQNAAFPALMAVCGPSEMQYWSQLKGIHERFDVPQPAVLPRDAATLIDAGTARDAARLGLDLEELVRGQAELPSPQEADPIAARLRLLGNEAAELFRAVEDGSLDLPPNTEKNFRRTVGRLEDDLGKLAGRLDDARSEAAGAGKRRYEKVLEELRPRGGLQERTHSLFPHLLRHGADLATKLREAFDPFEIGHYLVRP
ncbi:MAG: bacillithiol biosynthesis protein BshC [Planctomycetota bacterium]